VALFRASSCDSVSEISPHHSFLRKNFDVLMRSRAGPVTEFSFFAIEISVTGMKIFSYEHSSLQTKKKASRSQHSGQNGIIFPCMQFYLGGKRIT